MSANRRTAARRQPALGTVCHLTGDHGRLGLVWNLSTSGVSMLVDEPPHPDAVMDAQLTTVDEKQTLPITLRVVHVRRIRTGDYFLGAQFQRSLHADELAPFLAEAS